MLSVHQLVHGYDGGHRLLAGSCEPPSAASRRILIQSDLSGSLPPQTYQTYLTGYPVDEMDSYAFARTWYAKEMPRPGCVWTHTFLIPRSTLDGLKSLEFLARNFKRPTAETLTSYHQPLLFETRPLKLTGLMLPEAHALARAFYRQPPRPLVLAASLPDRGEILFLALWAQLWPSARMALAFSSGSLAARKIDGRPFDLQLAPHNLVRDVARSAGTEPLDLKAFLETQSDQREWWTVAEDLVSSEDGEFRAFLHRVADEQLTRGDVPGVARVFDLVSQRLSWNEASLRELYSRVAVLFPTQEQAIGLKRYCLDLAETTFGASTDHWLIVEMSSQGWGEAFSSPRLRLAERTNRQLSGRSDSVAGLLDQLLGHSLNTFGERVALETIATLNPSQVTTLLSRRPQFISTFVKLRPALTSDASFWRALHSSSHEILEALAIAVKQNPEVLSDVFPALVASGLEYEASHFVDLFGTAAAESIFLHRGSTPLAHRDRWLDALAARPDVILATLNKLASLPPEVVSGVAVTYAPSRAAAGGFPLAAWKAGMEGWSHAFAPEVESTVEACAFSFALALHQSTPLAADLAVLSFATVHEAAESGRLPSAAWSNLEPVVPSISIFKDWDRCERMRRALIFNFARGRWPIDRFFPALTDSDILHEVVKSAIYLSDGSDLVNRLADGIKSKTVVPEAKQLQVFHDTLERKFRRGR